MKSGRRNHGAVFKAKVALDAVRGEKSMAELAAEHGVHPTQIAKWRKQVLEELPGVFSSRRGRQEQDEEALKARLYQQIGQLQVELDWLKKRLFARICG